MPKQINTPFPGAELVRRFQLKGRFQPVLDEVIVPVVLVDQQEGGDEELGGYVSAYMGVSELATPGAASNSTHILGNPPGSGVIVLLDWFRVSQWGDGYIDVRFSDFAPASWLQAATVSIADRSGPTRNVFGTSGARAQLIAEHTPPVLATVRIERLQFRLGTAGAGTTTTPGSTAQRIQTPLCTLSEGQGLNLWPSAMLQATTTVSWGWRETRAA